MVGSLLAAFWAWVKGLSGTTLFSFVAFIFACTSAGAFFIDRRRLTMIQLKAALKSEQESQFDVQFDVERIGEPLVQWKKFAESSLRPLVPDIVVVPPDNLALVVHLNVKSSLEREVEVTLRLLNTGWTDIPDNRPRLSKVSTGPFTVSFDLTSQIDPALYHAEVIVKPLGGEKKGVLFTFEIPRVYPEF